MCNILKADDNESGVIAQTPNHHGFVKMARFSPDNSRLFTLDHGHTGTYDVLLLSNYNLIMKYLQNINIQKVKKLLKHQYTYTCI